MPFYDPEQAILKAQRLALQEEIRRKEEEERRRKQLEEFKKKQEETLRWAIAEIKMLLRRFLFIFGHNFIEQGKVTPEEIEMVVEQAGIDLYNWAKADPQVFSEAVYQLYSMFRMGKALLSDMGEQFEYYDKEFIQKMGKIMDKLGDVALYKGALGVSVTEDVRHLLEVGFASRLNGNEKVIEEFIDDFVERLKAKAKTPTETSNSNKLGR